VKSPIVSIAILRKDLTNVKTDRASKRYTHRGYFDLARAAANSPHGRADRPEDIAASVVPLASEDASWITGETLLVSGGEQCDDPGLARYDGRGLPGICAGLSNMHLARINV
jgi:NAD(P)-dependent dehydrogenase (short-subunit alcohol dehydrogenase family)